MRLLVVLIFSLLGSVVVSTAARATDVEVDSEAAGGDGVAGQVIGAFTTGNSVVIATSNSRHVSAEGGNAKTANHVKVSDRKHLGPIAVEAAAGDGVAAQVAEAAVQTDSALPIVALSSTDVSVFEPAVLFDLGP